LLTVFNSLYDVTSRYSPTQAPFNMSLAMFLLGMEAHSYFGASAGYNDWPVADWHWWDAYDRQLGVPAGEMVVSGDGGFQFTREFAHASVGVDCNTNTSFVRWH
jgi:hypothetical protein